MIRIETPGPAMHEVDIYRLHEGKTVADLNRWRKQEGVGSVPAEAWAVHSTAMISAGWCGCGKSSCRGVTSCTVKCLSPSTNPELTHADAGMVREFED